MTKIKRKLISTAKARSKKNNLPFDITIEDFSIPDVCPILAIKLQKGEGTCLPSSPSLDKIIPELGYVKGNVQVISHKANSMKQNATPWELIMFADWVRRMHK